MKMLSSALKMLAGLHSESLSVSFCFCKGVCNHCGEQLLCLILREQVEKWIKHSALE